MKSQKIGSMKHTKKLLINQPAGIGDILFIQKIVSKLSEEYEVYLPVKESISWMTEYLSTTCKREDCKDVHFDEVIRLDGCILPGHKIMESKYKLTGFDYVDYVDYISIKRDFKKEDALFSKVASTSPYRLVCPWYGTPEEKGTGMLKMDIPFSNDLENVVMNIEEGYTLFDWIKVIQNATEIHTTDGAIMFLVEMYKCESNKLVAYSRRFHTSEVDYLFNKKWEYVI